MSTVNQSTFTNHRQLLKQVPQLPFVSIALITFNARKTIRECLQSLYHLDYPLSRFEVIIVDAGSTDGTLDIVKSYPAKVILQPRKNRGFARNTAVEQSKGEILAFIDADCVATTTWLDEHVRIHEDPNILIVGGSVVQGGDRSLPTTIYHDTYFAAQSPSLPRHRTWDLATCNASFKRSTFWKIGLFPEINRGEDSLLCWETLQKGYVVVYDPTPSVVHIHTRFSFHTLFKRSREQGAADHEIQQAFGKHSPFRLPRSPLASCVLFPSLVLARFARYLTELLQNSKIRRIIFDLPIILAISILWTFGYVASTNRRGSIHG